MSTISLSTAQGNCHVYLDGHISSDVYYFLMLEQFLSSLQLTEKERFVFRTVLALGAQPASVVARHLEIPRNTVRSILDGLVRRGLLVRSRRASTQYYAVDTFENLQRLLEHREEQVLHDLTLQRRALSASKEELLSWTHASSRPKVTFYEGWSGVEKVYEDTLTAREGELKAWASYEANNEALPEYFKTYYVRRAKKGIHMTSIHPDGPIAEQHLKEPDRELRTSALVPTTVFNIGPEIQMYDNKVNIVSWKEKLGIIIESHEIADAMKAIFDLSFEAAQRYGKVTRPKKRAS